jgi:heptosyltransferase-1
MGDIIHALPAVASLKKSFPQDRVAWLVAPRWIPLLEGNPHIDELIPFHRHSVGALKHTWIRLRQLHPELAFDFQGLVQSALAGRVAQPKLFYGFDSSVAREPLASAFYWRRIAVTGPHRIERNIQLIQAAGATQITHEAWLPPGRDEGTLPSGPFVLASPFAGWSGKQWPLENYERLAEHLRSKGLELVANVSQNDAPRLGHLRHLRVHTSSIAGLIAATRQSIGVIGVDSGPLHLAAALNKPGVALYGPTDPTRTGPFRSRIVVLRSPDAETTYERHRKTHPSMNIFTVDQVAEALLASTVRDCVRY